MPAEIGAQPRAVLMVSGHWETDGFAVMHGARPPMIYDYSGFPPETYRISCPAPGAPDLAEDTAALIAAAGLPVRLDDARGCDHGTFAGLSRPRPVQRRRRLELSVRLTRCRCRGYGGIPPDHNKLRLCRSNPYVSRRILCIC